MENENFVYEGKFTLTTKDVRFAQNYAHVELRASENDNGEYATYQVAISPNVVKAAEGNTPLSASHQNYYGDAAVAAVREMLNLVLDVQSDDSKGEVMVEVIKVIVGAKPDLSEGATIPFDADDAPKYLSSDPLEDVKRAARAAFYRMADGIAG